MANFVVIPAKQITGIDTGENYLKSIETLIENLNEKTKRNK